MARSLADQIEQYLKALIEHSEKKQIEIQRMELAETFSCVPSQVTYVVSTRFGPNSGYITESRRGGSGCVRIRKLRMFPSPLENDTAVIWLANLYKNGQLTEREALLAGNFYHHCIEPLKISVEEKLILLENTIRDFLSSL